jgi:hypothetical protein
MLLLGTLCKYNTTSRQGDYSLYLEDVYRYYRLGIQERKFRYPRRWSRDCYGAHAVFTKVNITYVNFEETSGKAFHGNKIIRIGIWKG